VCFSRNKHIKDQCWHETFKLDHYSLDSKIRIADMTVSAVYQSVPLVSTHVEFGLQKIKYSTEYK
jgi:hypothetical protein